MLFEKIMCRIMLNKNYLDRLRRERQWEINKPMIHSKMSTSMAVAMTPRNNMTAKAARSHTYYDPNGCSSDNDFTTTTLSLIKTRLGTMTITTMAMESTTMTIDLTSSL